MVFHEVRAKSVLNGVPGSSLPFSWTVNPYRGCSHACTYCLAGDTPVLMGDGRTKPLSSLREGDQIYGTELVGNYRRYKLTTVAGALGDAQGRVPADARGRHLAGRLR